jgi:NADH dehydrogenase [ubiquinone] 1 alpha subcomplex assembly factor 1
LRTCISLAGINPDPIVLSQFRGKADLDKWRVFTDASFGGTSTAKLELSAEGQSAVFSGQYSKDVGEAGHLVRSGYCGINHVRPRNVDLSMHDYLDFRIRGDGNTYIASLRADQMTGGDEEAWQAPLPTRSYGEWENVRLELDDFIFTFRGRLVKKSQSIGTIPKERIMSVGIILAASDDMDSTGGFR